ncbi:hypothetical protein [Amycolatopsis azurea]|uniref:Small secreted protein n=1 Tax=Amycolatopsis azurea DSM 43854 TaxID=1238180 RepID=M2PT76_9PSEU|nr:hypothetical protein [Amycolatopsis azurea]EMD22735.1 hypothetical protein C791_8059 [Amycolatopsis azurea DSM 43854]OOC00854.1 hypothetical protein B0293_40950 [Amycolatopsis azurea DSM 43854]
MLAAKKAPAAVVAAIGIALALTGCTPAPQAMEKAPVAPSSSAADQSATVAWMNGFCGAVKDFIDGNNKMPAAGGDTVEAITKSTSDQLGHYASILGKTVEELNALPSAPVPAADAAKKDFLGKYTAARDKVVKAKADLDAAKRSDTAAQARAVDGLMAAQKDAHGALDPVKAVLDSPELTKAAATAERCRP